LRGGCRPTRGADAPTAMRQIFDSAVRARVTAFRRTGAPAILSSETQRAASEDRSKIGGGVVYWE